MNSIQENNSNNQNEIQYEEVDERKYYAIIGILVVIVIILSVGLFKSQSGNKKLTQELASQKNSGDTSQNETAQILSKISELIVLPQNEQPTIATVVDLNKLQGQPFFKNAQLGDKVIIYSQAGKAILFRPSENKIVEVAPFTNPTPTLAPTPDKTSSPNKK